MDSYKTQLKTFSDRLSQKRVRLNISLDDASKESGIPFKYLEALEAGNFSNLPDKSQIKILLSKYCVYLNVDFKACWRDARRHRNFPGFKSSHNVDAKYLLSWPQTIRKILIVVLIITILVFLIFKVERIFSSPDLTIITPDDGSIVTVKQIDIIGESEPEVELIINNREIFVDESGNFKTSIDLQKGLNLIKITAKKRYSRVKEAEIRLLFKD